MVTWSAVAGTPHLGGLPGLGHGGHLMQKKKRYPEEKENLGEGLEVRKNYPQRRKRRGPCAPETKVETLEKWKEGENAYHKVNKSR